MVSIKYEFFINTTQDIFAAWLQKHTRSLPFRSFPIGEERLLLQPVQTSGRPNLLASQAYRIYVDRNGVEQYQPIGQALCFGLMPLADNRLEVTAECISIAVLPYFLELLINISTVWPESGIGTPPATTKPEPTPEPGNPETQ